MDIGLADERKNQGSLNLALLGCGTVGGGVVNVLMKQRELLKSFEDASNPSTSPASTGFFARVKEFFEDLRE